jgi:hypothetical protein
MLQIFCFAWYLNIFLKPPFHAHQSASRPPAERAGIEHSESLGTKRWTQKASGPHLSRYASKFH